ncbi:MAG TPA: HlyD family efflux transporter periplasmic adaptor subunit [Blastocatellia bacterium]|nr:HlyD family efflux transporter periplasmic adaptor subunit [Blastocatellia bacterium]
MDIPRKSAARKRRIRQIIYAVVAVIGIAAISLGVSKLKPAAPSVENVIIDTVKRGLFVKQVRGPGTLVPEEIRWLPAQTNGRVERIILRPPTAVKADSVILELSNPELERDVLDAESQLKAAEAEMARLKVQLKSDQLRQEADAAHLQSDYKQAKMRADTDAELAKQGLIGQMTADLSRLTEQELANRNRIEQERLRITLETNAAQLAVQQAQVDQRRSNYQLRHSQLDSLKVRATIDGVLQLLPVEVGQQVAPGTNLARVSQPSRLKAELRIAETQTKDIQLGQKATIDIRSGMISGVVSRVDLAPQNGTLAVDVRLEGELPKGARPDLNVEGTIELERVEDLVFMGRPVQGQENATIMIFKLDPDGKTATKTRVKLGRTSVSTIEIIDGLQVGDRVILSDMSNWDTVDRVRVN